MDNPFVQSTIESSKHVQSVGFGAFSFLFLLNTETNKSAVSSWLKYIQEAF